MDRVGLKEEAMIIVPGPVDLRVNLLSGPTSRTDGPWSLGQQ